MGSRQRAGVGRKRTNPRRSGGRAAFSIFEGSEYAPIARSNCEQHCMSLAPDGSSTVGHGSAPAENELRDAYPCTYSAGKVNDQGKAGRPQQLWLLSFRRVRSRYCISNTPPCCLQHPLSERDVCWWTKGGPTFSSACHGGSRKGVRYGLFVSRKTQPSCCRPQFTPCHSCDLSIPSPTELSSSGFNGIPSVRLSASSWIRSLGRYPLPAKHSNGREALCAGRIRSNPEAWLRT